MKTNIYGGFCVLGRINYLGTFFVIMLHIHFYSNFYCMTMTIQKYLIASIFALCVCTLSAQNDAYNGFRLYMSDIEVLKINAKSIKIKCNITNTGRENIVLGKKESPDFLLNFDQTLTTNKLDLYQNQLKMALQTSPLSIKIDDVKMGLKLELAAIATVTADSQNIVKQNEKIPETPEKIEPKEPKLEKIPEKISQNIENVETQKHTPPLSIKAEEAPKTIESKVIATADTMPVETAIATDSACIDLVIDTVKVQKLDDKYIWLEITMLNKGTAPAPLFGAKRGNTDNVAIHFFFAGTKRLTRGAALADGIYLTEGLKETKGLLQPNIPYTQVFKLSLEKKTPFTGVIILQLDAFDVLRECDETNNVKAIVPKWF